MSQELIATGNILDTLSVERERINAEQTKHMARELHLLAARLRKAWDEAYKPIKVKPIAERSKRGGRGRIRYRGSGENESQEPSTNKSEMELRLENGRDLREQCDRIIKTADPIIEEFRVRVLRANAFVAKNIDAPIEVLQTEEYRLYCSVQENSRLNPRMLVPTSAQKSLEFATDLLSKHTGPLLITKYGRC